ncbi:MAG: hypothetical protein ACREXT_11125 [Gammaproteobacteria bacterium]
MKDKPIDKAKTAIKTKARRKAETALGAYRTRMKRRGVMRVEVQVNKEDAGLIRAVAIALSDPAREAHTRAWLRKELGGPPSQGLKALLAAAPLEGIDIKRPRDIGRAVKV